MRPSKIFQGLITIAIACYLVSVQGNDENEQQQLHELPAGAPLAAGTTTMATYAGDVKNAVTNGSTTMEDLIAEIAQLKKAEAENFRILKEEISQRRSNSSNSDQVTGELDGLRDQVEKLRDQVEKLSKELALQTSRLEETKKAVTSKPTVAPPDNCGGLLTISYRTPQVVTDYRNPGNWGDSGDAERTCVWFIISTFSSSGPLSFTLTALDLLENSTSALSLQQISTNDDSTVSRSITSGDKGTAFSLNGTMALLVFRSNGTERFRMSVRDLVPSTGTSNTDYRFNVHFLSQTTATSLVEGEGKFAYPDSSLMDYLPNERRFVIMKGYPDKKILINMDRFSSETTHDYLMVMKFSRSQNKFLLLKRFTGYFPIMNYQNFDGEENQPMVLYFHSDSSVQTSGFALTYSYRLPNETVKTIWNDIDVQTTFDKCGGFVELPNITQIVYENSANDSKPQICSWYIRGAGTGPIAYMLESSNFTLTNDNSSVSASLNLFSQGMWSDTSLESRQIMAEDQGIEIMTQGLYSVNALLVFNSTGGQGHGFRLSVRDQSKRPHYASSFNGTIYAIQNDEKNNSSNIDAQWATFSIPSVPGTNYSSNERSMVIFNPPQGPNGRLEFSLDFVDTESYGDPLRVYKYLENDKKFQFFGRYSGRIGNLTGATMDTGPSQLLLLQFFSDSAVAGKGFKVSYKYQKNSSSLLQGGIKNSEENEENSFGETCGGLALLPNDTQVSFKNDRANNETEEKMCFWIIRTNHGIIGLTLTSENFTSNPNASLTIQSGFNLQNSTLSKSILAKDKGIEIAHEATILALVFKSSAAGQYFSVKIRRLGQYTVSGLFAKESWTKFDVESEKMETFRYPDHSNASSYQALERRFVIFQPQFGHRVNLQLDHLDTEVSADFLHIFGFSKQDDKFLFLQRFTGDIGEHSHSDILEGEPDQPILLYFHSDVSSEGSGFAISYWGQDESHNQSQINISSATPVVHTASCGGLLVLRFVSKPLEVVYKNPIKNEGQEEEEEETCIWVVWSSGQISLNLTSLDLLNVNGTTETNVNGTTTTNARSLTVQYNFRNENATLNRVLTSNDTGQLISISNEYIILLTFSSRGGDGFRLRMSSGQPTGILEGNLEYISSGRMLRVGVNFLGRAALAVNGSVSAAPALSTFSHPKLPGAYYRNNERRFVVIKALPGKKIRIISPYINSYPGDYMSLFAFSRKLNKFLFLKRLSGGYIQSSSSFDGNENEPIIAYFHSDGSNQRIGFRFNYAYKLPNDTLSGVVSPTSTAFTISSTTFTGCGGIVSRPDYNVLTYENPSETNATSVKTCVWVIWSKPGYPVGLKLTNSNFLDVTGSNKNATLYIQSGLTLENAMSRRLVLESDKNSEIVISSETVLLLSFTSKVGGQSFRMTLRDTYDPAGVIYYRRQSPVIVDVKVVGTFTLFGDSRGRYLYPAMAGVYYLSGAKNLLFLTPRAGRVINLTVDYVHSSASDILRVYKYSSVDQKFLFHGKFSGRLEELGDGDGNFFEGEEGMPILLYFQATSYGSGNGFKVTYNYRLPSVATPDAAAAGELPQSFGSSCGGMILLPNATEVSYKNDDKNVENEQSNMEDSCFFLVVSENSGGIIGFRPLNDEEWTGFDNNRLLVYGGVVSDVKTTWTRRTLEKNSTEFLTDGPITLLVAKTTTNTPQKFRLGVRAYGKIKGSPEDTLKYERLDVIGLESHEFGSVSMDMHTSMPSPTTSGSTSSTSAIYERKVLILKPYPGESINLWLNYNFQQSAFEFLTILKFSGTDNSLHLVKRPQFGTYTTETLKNEHNEPFLGDKNDVFAIYTRSSGSNRGASYTVSYSSQPPSTTTLESKLETDYFLEPMENETIVSRSCGGLIILRTSMEELTYKTADVITDRNVQDEEMTCVWVIWAKNSGTMTITPTHLDLDPDDHNGSLTIQKEFEQEKSTKDIISITSSKIGKDIPVKKEMVLLIFNYKNSWRPQSFTLKLKDSSLPAGNPFFNLGLRVIANYIGWPSLHPGKFSYPTLAGSLYANNERRFVVIQSFPQTKIQWSLDHLTMEEGHDFLDILKFSKQNKKFLLLRRFSGDLASIKNELNVTSFEGDEGQPMAVYFHADHFHQGEGFKFSFSYKKDSNLKSLQEKSAAGITGANEKGEELGVMEVASLVSIGVLVLLILLTISVVILHRRGYFEHFVRASSRRRPDDGQALYVSANNLRADGIMLQHRQTT